MKAVSIGRSRKRAERMTPVNPIPPSVARKRPACCLRLHSRTSPSAVASVSDSTCAPKPVAVMVLAVYVRGDHAPDGDELRSRNYGREPAPRRERFQDIREQHAGLAAQQAGLGVERLHPIHRRHRQRQLRIERGVAVGAPVAAGDQRTAAAQQSGQVLAPAQTLQPAIENRIPAPSAEPHVTYLRKTRRRPRTRPAWMQASRQRASFYNPFFLGTPS